VAKRGGRRGRPGQPRGRRRGTRSGSGGQALAAPDAAPATAPERGKRQGQGSRAGRAAGRLAEQAALGERPQAPWHPLPLSELLILVGMIGAIIGAGRESLITVGAGILAVCVGTLDFTIREHLSGYRSHTTLLAAVPTAIVHGLLAIALLALGAPSPSWIVVPLVIDVPLFWFLYRLLRDRFRDARRERVFAASR
jgi:hypothetical protein